MSAAEVSAEFNILCSGDLNELFRLGRTLVFWYSAEADGDLLGERN